LQECTQRLLRALQIARREKMFSDQDLPDIAYTLQVGREPMEERLGFVANSLDDLCDKLSAVIDGSGASVADVHRGAVKPNRDTLAIFQADEDFCAAVDAWVARGKYKKVLQLWVKGLP